MSHVRNRFRLLKDGEIVYEQISDPKHALFMMRELKPEHDWRVVEIFPDLESERDALIREIKRLITRVEKIDAEPKRMPPPPKQLDGEQN